jgi:hypothetical protein
VSEAPEPRSSDDAARKDPGESKPTMASADSGGGSRRWSRLILLIGVGIGIPLLLVGLAGYWLWQEPVWAFSSISAVDCAWVDDPERRAIINPRTIAQTRRGGAVSDATREP